MKIELMNDTSLQNLTDVKVVKRDGTETPFYGYKIDLVLKELNADSETKAAVYQELLSFMGKKTVSTIEIAQAFISGLKKADQNILAQKYVNYRRQDEENFAEATDPQYKLSQLFDRNSRVVHENANKDSHVFNTQRDLEAGVVSRALGLKMLPDLVAKALDRL